MDPSLLSAVAPLIAAAKAIGEVFTNGWATTGLFAILAAYIYVKREQDKTAAAMKVDQAQLRAEKIQEKLEVELREQSDLTKRVTEVMDAINRATSGKTGAAG